MDQSQHSLADHGGEGAAYEFAQGLDTWEKERESGSPGRLPEAPPPNRGSAMLPGAD